ncbi:MAG: type IV pilus modification protein PilV [Cellvibrionaceae bacterium]|nr:type IV pilus modification protein PilV [Cellvibrionaceae bacterium]
MYKQRGSSLIEVLVSLFVLAVGLLGILAMQIKSVQFNKSADSYAKAMNIANDIAERIRINPKNVAAYTTTDLPDEPPTDCLAEDVSAAACSAGDLVNWDLYHWNETIKQNLPAGTGSIAQKTLGTSTYLQIIVSFDDSRPDGSSTAGRKQYTLLVERPTQLGGA